VTQIRRLAPLLLVLLVLASAAAQEDAALPYAVTIRPTGIEALDGPIEQASRLRRLATTAPVDAFGLVARARGEAELLEEVLRSEGYWAGRIAVRIAGEPADSPGLAERLAARRGEIPVEVTVEPGPLYRLRRIALRPARPAEAAAVAALGDPPGLAQGDPARAGAVLDAEQAMLGALRAAAHPLAKVEDREVLVDHDAKAMDVAWLLDPGPAAVFARPEVSGDTALDPAVSARVAGRLTGEPYSPERLERNRRALLSLGVFESVRARAADRLDAQGALPVTFEVADRPRNAAGFTLAYETNYGPSGKVYYERRNLFGHAELLRLEGEVSRIGTGGGTSDINYRAGVSLRRPAMFDGFTTMSLEAGAVRERLEAYDRDAVTAAVLAERALGERWVLRGGPSFESGRIGQGGTMAPFTLLGLLMAARYDGTDSLLDPRRGLRADISVTPFADLAEGGGFGRAVGTLRTYFDLTGDGGSVIALRGTLGSLVGASGKAPLDKRFYAGGGGSVRGYGFQMIGPRNANGQPSGGSSLVEASVEWRQRVSGNFGLVGFLDAGTVGTSETPNFSDVNIGVGLGVRYATAIGPLRLDVAVPLDRVQGNSGYGVYVGLGQAF
jgi:translocation and assembly module TamA